ncbi:hypothetical protein SAMN05443549_10956 [Flavobacterium fluvii]|uniref:Uncharacterized protein n=2 Tax=Flavobacterium fluvii TaxID=468056 RepID=A0A1M5P3T9_9FLAO|nr:hypothetical protein SAMN05443549_10956 [Flavobacterium fluvii]
MLSIFSDIENVREIKITEFENQIKAWSNENSIGVREIWNELADEHFDHYNHYKNHINYMVLNSLFISTFSLFENHLNRIAELAYEELKPSIKIVDIKGNGELDTCRKYLNIVCNVKSANSDFHKWQEIIQYKAIRNSIVHNGSVLNRAEKENLEKIPGYPLIKKYNMWHTPKVVYFRINQVNFLEDFIKLSIDYSINIVYELTH